MLRILFRTIVVCIGLLLLLLAAQRVTEGVSRPNNVLRLVAEGVSAAGDPVQWTLSVTEEGLMDVDGRPTPDLASVRRQIASVLPNGSLTIRGRVLTPMNDREIETAIRKLSDGEQSQVAAEKLAGVIARLQELRGEGVALGKLSRDDLARALDELRPTKVETAAVRAALACGETMEAAAAELVVEGEAAKRKLGVVTTGVANLKRKDLDADALGSSALEKQIPLLAEAAKTLAAADRAAARNLAKAAEDARQAAEAFVAAMQRAAEREVTLGSPARKSLEELVLEARNWQRTLDGEQMLELAVNSQVDNGRLNDRKAGGLLGDIEELASGGASFEKLTAEAAGERLAALELTPAEIEAVHGATRLLARQWTYTIADGQTTVDGLPGGVKDLEARVYRYASSADQATHAVTVADVIRAAREGKLRAPSRPYYSFPGRMTYEQAWPKGEKNVSPPRAEKPEYVITHFADSPTLHDKGLQEKLKIRQYVDGQDAVDDDWDTLPPVEERLPLYPAVMVGPDGEGPNHVGRYGGIWKRCTSGDFDVGRKIGYPSFLRFDPKGDLQPHFAYKWKVEDNNRVYTFYLRKGHRWSDGHPWTAHDIAWVCNVLIGSPYWSDASDWMMETDGSLLLYADDVPDWAALAKTILEQASADGPSPGKQILAVADGAVRTALSRLVAEDRLNAKRAEAMQTAFDGMDRPALAALLDLDDTRFREKLSEYGLTQDEEAAVCESVGELKLVKLRPMLEGVTPEHLPDELGQAKIVGLLNKAFESTQLYSDAAWAGVDLKSEREALMARGPSTLDAMERQRLEFLIIRDDLLRRVRLSAEYADLLKKKGSGTLSEDDRQRLDKLSPDDEWLRMGAGDINLTKEPALLKKFNLFMFRAAYRDLVAKAVRERVKVEALSDDVVRFTFKKPNAIFLEKTATFMYYRGIFDASLHFAGQMHPDGTSLLAVDDFFDWDGFLEKVVEAGASDEASPGRQLWTHLDAEFQEAFRQGVPPTDSDAWKKSVVDELNRIMLSARDFYTAEAWKGVDLTSELAKLQATGYTKLTDSKDKRRYLQLLERADLLRRGVAALKATGEDDPSDEMLVFNVAMFRAAFSASDPTLEWSKRVDESLVAYNRENALDMTAKNDFYKFDGWVSKLRALGGTLKNRYHRPVLTPWRTVSDPLDIDSVSIRNPYYFAVDAEGNQLPYIDVFVNETQGRPEVRILKLSSGNASFQCRELTFRDFTVLKQSETQGDYKVYLWANDYCGEVQFYFPQPRKDPEMLRLEADPRFRWAMSYALNRQEMIDVIYQGMGQPAQWSIPKGSKYYNEKMATAAVAYRPDLANQLLDEMGLDKRDTDGVRLLWSGQRLILDVVTVQENPLEAVQMACNYWQAIGVSCQMKVQTQTLINTWLGIGKLDIGVHKEGGNYFGPILAGQMAPTHPAECPWGLKWVEWLRNGGSSGWEPPDRIKELDLMWNRVVESPDQPTLLKRWNELCDYTAEQLPQIAIMTSPGTVVYVKNGFKNVPPLSLAGWMAHEPGNNCPEVFYWDKQPD